MDRLICGDVGYGKTEVAVRTAFKTVMEGKQAAILVTTRWLSSSGKPSSDADMATKQDTELSWLNLGGGELQLITNEVSQRVLAPQVHVVGN